MQVSFRKNSTTEASVIVKIEEIDYQARVLRKIEEHSKKAYIKGFRPGSVPSKIIRQRYGRSILIEEVNSLLAESLTQYLKKHKIYVLGEPMPVLEKIEAIDWEHQRDFELEYTVGMAGPFTCELSKDIKVVAYKIGRVADQTIDALIEQLRKVHGKTEVVTESTANDEIHGEFFYPKQDFKVKTKVAIEEVAKGVREIFIALSPQDKITVDVAQLFRKPVKLPAVTREMCETMLSMGGPATFTVEKIYRRTIAPLAQEFFDKVLGRGVASFEQDFKTKLKTRFLQSKQQEANFRLEQSIQAALCKKTTIALPDGFIKNWLQERNKIPTNQIEAYYQQYAKTLRWRLLIESLSKEHGIEANYEEVVDEVRRQLQATSEHNQAPKSLSEENITPLIQDFLQKNYGEHYRKVHESVLMRKMVNFIKNQITITEKEISVEKFDELASE